MNQHCRWDKKNKMLTLHNWHSTQLLTAQFHTRGSVTTSWTHKLHSVYQQHWREVEALDLPYQWRHLQLHEQRLKLPPFLPSTRGDILHKHTTERANSSKTGQRSKDRLSPALKWPWTFSFYICILALAGNKNYEESSGCATMLA